MIVREDEGTEPAYFDSFKAHFPDNTLYLKTIGTGKDPIGVVRQSIIERDTFFKRYDKEIDAVWAVFDKDDANLQQITAQRFDEALLLAKNNTIELAYSNEVFELWLLLHFKIVQVQVPISRATIYQQLAECIHYRLN